MPHEVLGSDISDQAGRETFLNVYAFTQENNIDSDIIYAAGDFTEWAHDTPEEANEFLQHCITHDNPHVRGFAGLVADDWKDISANDLVYDVMMRAMSDTDYIVLDRVIPYYYDVITDGFDTFIERFGLAKTNEFIKLFNQVKIRHDSNLRSR